MPAAQVDFGGTDGDLAGCSGWTYTVVPPDAADCGSGPSGQAPSTSTPITAGLTCGEPPGDGWNVHIVYQVPNGDSTSIDVPIVGPVPP